MADSRSESVAQNEMGTEKVSRLVIFTGIPLMLAYLLLLPVTGSR